MSYTLATLKTTIMDIIGEDSSSPTYWTATNDIEIEDYINDAVEEVCLLTGQYVEDVHCPLYANKQHYWIDSGKNSQILWINYARIEPESWRLGQVDPGKLSREDYNWMTRTGTPINFYNIGLDALRFIPYPVTDGKLIEMNVSSIPPALTEEDNVLNLHEENVNAVIAYSVAMLFLTLRGLDKAFIWFEKYLQQLGEAAKDGSTLLNKAIKPLEVGSATQRQFGSS